MKLYLRVLVVGWAVCPWGAYAQAVAPAGNPLDSLPQTPAVAPPPKPQVQITPPAPVVAVPAVVMAAAPEEGSRLRWRPSTT